MRCYAVKERLPAYFFGGRRNDNGIGAALEKSRPVLELRALFVFTQFIRFGCNELRVYPVRMEKIKGFLLNFRRTAADIHQ